MEGVGYLWILAMCVSQVFTESGPADKDNAGFRNRGEEHLCGEEVGSHIQPGNL